MEQKGTRSAISKGKAVGKSFKDKDKGRRIEELRRRRREAELAGKQDVVEKLNLQINKLNRGTYRSTTYPRANPRTSTSASIGFSREQGKPAFVPKDLEMSLFLDTDDAVTALKVLKAAQRIACELGYETPSITDVERGSILATFRAAWGSDKGQKVVADSKAKAKEIIEEAEQYARLHVQEKQAAVDATNASSAAELMRAYSDIDRVAIKIGALLFVKYPAADGSSIVITRTLSAREMRIYDKTPTICVQPEKLEENLALLIAQEDEEPKAIEQ